MGTERRPSLLDVGADDSVRAREEKEREAFRSALTRLAAWHRTVAKADPRWPEVTETNQETAAAWLHDALRVLLGREPEHSRPELLRVIRGRKLRARLPRGWTSGAALRRMARASARGPGHVTTAREAIPPLQEAEDVRTALRLLYYRGADVSGVLRALDWLTYVAHRPETADETRARVARVAWSLVRVAAGGRPEERAAALASAADELLPGASGYSKSS